MMLESANGDDRDTNIPLLDQAIAMNPGAPQPQQPPGVDDGTAEQWREAERRQRSIRLLIMFLLMLIVMDGDHDEARAAAKVRGGNSSSSSKRLEALRLESEVYAARHHQDETIRRITQQHPRYQTLIDKNMNQDVPNEILLWAHQQLARRPGDDGADEPNGAATEGLTRDEFPAAQEAKSLLLRQSSSSTTALQQPADQQQHDPADDRKVYHYPWNSTGFYRGQWTRTESAATESAPVESATTESHQTESLRRNPSFKLETLDAVSLEPEMLQIMQSRSSLDETPIGVVILPPGKQLQMRNDHNYTSNRLEQVTVDVSGKTYPPKPLKTGSAQAAFAKVSESKTLPFSNDATAPTAPTNSNLQQPLPVTTTNNSLVTLTRDSGRVAFQIFSRKIPAVRELSLVDGFVKLYDSDTQGYSTRKDVLLRVRGVLVHAIGRLSLVANVDVQRSALVIAGSDTSDANASHHSSRKGNTATEAALSAANVNRHRRLQEALNDIDGADMKQVRRDAEALFEQQPLVQRKLAGQWLLKSPESIDRKLLDLPLAFKTGAMIEADAHDTTEIMDNAASGSNNTSPSHNVSAMLPPWSDIVMPYPFTRDDQHESIRKAKTPAARRMPAREQLLEANAMDCEYEISMDIEAVEWTVGAWRNLILRRLKEAKLLNPFIPLAETESASATADRNSGYKSRGSNLSARDRAKLLQDQAVVMSMIGKIESRNCRFSASLNATAIRTDWDATTSKAINYSFYMMLVCLTQILILLRQLLHSQSQSAATKVSLLCIGWQTVIDALVCLAHIYLSLAMQPLFAAFASVAFFKLLIFCVIEMKYMTIIIQARNNSTGGGQTQEALRRQVAVLHLRFYVTLFATFFLAFYVGEKYRTLYALLLYSFWVPQIIANVISETKKPMHKYYVYGMSLTRLVAPLYIFWLPNNFLKEVYPDSPTDPIMCELLILWVAVQTAVLLAQGKYGARFMIPARFLPPKFDYSRPLPASMLPPSTVESPKPELIGEDHRGSSPVPLGKDEILTTTNPLPPRAARHTTAPTTRNRMRGLRRAEGANSMIAETVTQQAPAAQFTLDCSICYEDIDTRNPRGYMLAPCNHLFHRDCLIQWMDIKMECPICRTNLPAL